MTVDRAAVVVLVLHRKRNINKMCENARGFCPLAFFVVGNRGEPEASRSGQDRRGGEERVVKFCISRKRLFVFIYKNCAKTVQFQTSSLFQKYDEFTLQYILSRPFGPAHFYLLPARPST